MNQIVRFPEQQPVETIDDCVGCLMAVLAFGAPPIWHLKQSQADHLLKIVRSLGPDDALCVTKVLTNCIHAIGEPRGVKVDAKGKGR